MAGDNQVVNVLMVCLGICRSPMAEAVLKHQITQRTTLLQKMDIKVDSAGTGAYHAGDDADSRTIETCRRHKIPISCTARKVTNHDFQKFDYIIAMDESNLRNLLNKQPSSSTSKVAMFGSYDPDILFPKAGAKVPKPKAIADPYYGGNSGFDDCYEQCVRYAEGFLDMLEKGDSDRLDCESSLSFH